MRYKLNGISPFIDEDFRPSSEVLERFATVFSENPAPTKTQLHLASKIRCDSLTRYINWMKRNNHVTSETQDRAEKFRQTNRGREMFSNLIKYLECVKTKKSIAVFSVLDVMILAVWMIKMF